MSSASIVGTDADSVPWFGYTFGMTPFVQSLESAGVNWRDLMLSTPGGYAFVATDGKFDSPKHITLLNRVIAEAAMTPNSFTAVAFPPRHGKSFLVSHHTPAWFLTRHPDQRVMLAGYEAEFAASWGRKARDTFDRLSPLTGLKVRQDNKAAHRWEVEGYGGEMYTAGVGGAITGRGGNLLICDDAVKNAEAAMSATMRQATWDWYLSTFATRKEPGASELLIATRWHMDDLTGRILEEGKAMGREVRYLVFPAIAEDDDVLGRAPGEALWPERYPVPALEEIKSMQGFWWDALYQQRPVPMGGALFKSEWFEKRYKIIGDGHRASDGWALPSGEIVRRGDCIIFAVVDPSLGKKGSDRCAMSVFACTPNGKLLVLFSRSERIPYDQIVFELGRLVRQWNCEYAGMESDGFQQQLAAIARRQLPVPIKDLKTESKSKLSRGIPAIELAAQGDVILPERGDWIAGYLSELCTWTGKDGDKDDQVDCLAYATQRALAIRGLWRDVHAYAGRLRGEAAPVTIGGRQMNWN